MYPLSYLLGFNKFKNGAWFDPSWDDRVSWMMELLEIVPGDRAVDIGSGDGRVVVAMAHKGAQVIGFEQDSTLVKQSNRVILEDNLQEHAHILQADMWQQSYGYYNKVALYQFKTVMSRMEQKLLAELPIGAKVVSNYWQFPHWKAINQLHDVYLYIKEDSYDSFN